MTSDQPTLQSWIDAIVVADRELADANRELARGDAEAGDDKPTQAIDHYRNAWKKAQEAVK